MNILKKLFSIFNKAQIPQGTTVASSVYKYLYPYITHAVYIDSSKESYIKQGYSKNNDLYAVINTIVRPAGKINWYLARVKDQKSFRRYKNRPPGLKIKDIITTNNLRNKALEEIGSHPILDLIDKPNKYQTGTEFRQQILGMRRLTGDSFLWGNVLGAGRNAGQPTELVLLPSQFVEIVWDHKLAEIKGYKLMYGGQKMLPAEQVGHIKYWNPNYTMDGNNLYGMAPTKAIEGVITRSNEAYDYNIKMLQNMGPPGLLNLPEKELTQDQYDKFDRMYRKRYGSTSRKNANMPMVLSDFGKVDWVNTGITPVDADLIKSQTQDLRNICNAHGINSALLNDPENKVYNNSKEARKALYIDAIIPELEDLKQFFNNWLVPMFDSSLYLDYDVQDIEELQDNFNEQTQALNNAWWIKGNEKRIAQGYEDDPKLDDYFIDFSKTRLSEMENNGISDEDLNKALAGIDDYN